MVHPGKPQLGLDTKSAAEGKSRDGHGDDSFLVDDDSYSRNRRSSRHKRKRKRQRREDKHHKRRRRRSYSSSTESSNSSSDDSSSYHRRRRKRREKKRKKKTGSSRTTTKRKRSKDDDTNGSIPKADCQNGIKETKAAPIDGDANESTGIQKAGQAKRIDEIEEHAPLRMMVPMSKEEYEKEQSKIRQVYDPESGRYRMVRGSGEIIESIVSRADHQRINQQATRGDGASFARSTLLAATRRKY